MADHAGVQQALEDRDRKFILSDPSKSRMESWQHEGGLSAEIIDWASSMVFRVELQLSNMECMVSTTRLNHREKVVFQTLIQNKKSKIDRFLRR